MSYRCSFLFRSSTQQHLSRGRKHASTVQPLPGPEPYSGLHCQRRQTSSIGESQTVICTNTCCLYCKQASFPVITDVPKTFFFFFGHGQFCPHYFMKQLTAGMCLIQRHLQLSSGSFFHACYNEGSSGTGICYFYCFASFRFFFSLLLHLLPINQNA